MSGTTTKGLPFPTGTDRVMDGDDAIAALATALDFTSAKQLPTTTTAAAPFTAYPDGLSVLLLSTANASAGGWPEGGSSHVFTIRNNDRLSQFWFRNSSSGNIQYRTISNASAWSPWQMLNVPATASGSATLTPSAADTAVGVAVTFPAGRFAVPPLVFCQWLSAIGNNSSQYQINWPSGITADGFTLQVRRWSAVATLVGWVAHAQ